MISRSCIGKRFRNKDAQVKRNVMVYGHVVAMLAACSGSSGNNGTENAFAFTTIAEGGASFAELVDNALPQDELTPTTDRSDLPSGGDFTYDGIIFVGLDNGSDDSVLGTIRVTATFADNGLTGSAGSFVNANDEAVGGQLQIDGNFASSGPAGGLADVDGTVEFEAGTMVIDAVATHGFTGASGEYHIGAVLDGDGTAQPAIGAPIEIDLSWAAERQ